MSLVVADVVVYASIRSYLYQQVDASLEASHPAVEATADNPQSAMTNSGEPRCRRPAFDGNLVAAELVGTFAPSVERPLRGCSSKCWTSSTKSSHRPPASRSVRRSSQGARPLCPSSPRSSRDFRRTRSDPRSRRSTSPLPPPTRADRPFESERPYSPNGGVLILAEPIGGITNTLSQLLLVEVIVTAAALITAALLGLWLVRLGLRPLVDIERTANAIAEGDLMHRAPHADSPTEVGHLATAFNVMLERVQQTVSELTDSEERLRRFVGDASHELRTPTAAVSAYAQLFKHGIASRPEELDRVMMGIQRESGRMAQLVEDLLLLAKLDEHRPLTSDPVELVGLVFEAADTARVWGQLGRSRSGRTKWLKSSAIEDALRQVVDNLLSNVRCPHTFWYEDDRDRHASRR